MAGRIPKVVVVGPAYVDMAVKCEAFPGPGRVAEGSSFSCVPTGAGVNRALQAALCDCEVYLLARVGEDTFGKMIKDNLRGHRVYTDLIYTSDAISTGVIVTVVDARGGNSSCRCAGANRAMGRDEIEYAAAEQIISTSDVCLVCGELPESAVVAAIRTAGLYKIKTVLELCMAGHDREAIVSLSWPTDYYNADILILRFSDFAGVSELGAGGVQELKHVGMELVARGANCVVVSLGRRGSLIADRQGCRQISGIEMEVVDNTGAQDAFCGALAASIGSGDGPDQAVRFAVAAETLARGRFGLQEAIAKKEDIIALLQRQPD